MVAGAPVSYDCEVRMVGLVKSYRQRKFSVDSG